MNSSYRIALSSLILAILSLFALSPKGVLAQRLQRPTAVRSQTSDQNSSLSAPTLTAVRSIAAGMSMRWWRKFKNPSFCPFIICGGSCADISGVPKIGAYSPSELVSEETPCSLDSITSSDSGGCCMSDNIDTHAHMDAGSSAANGSDCCSQTAPTSVESSTPHLHSKCQD